MIKALFGFSPDLAPFAGKTPAEQAAILRAWGGDAVFGGYQTPGFVEAVHAAGMKIYAELACFFGESWWQTLPASRPVTETGELLPNEAWYYAVNPATPEVRRERLEALGRLLAEYALDGVWLDFIRWPCHWEVPEPYLPRTSFDPDTLARFAQDSGVALPPGETRARAQAVLERYESEWTAWRCQQITSWVAEAKAVLRRTRPDALLGLFGVPWRLADREGAILKVIGQDYRALGQVVDVFSPMVYHRMCGYPPAWIGEVVEEIHELSGKPVWPIIQSVDEPGPLSAEEYGECLDIALGQPASGGVVVFTVAGLLDEAKLAVTQARFKPQASL
jgi:hypothetical protein